MINQERIKNLLLELIQIDSHSRKERDIALRIKNYCEELGAEVEIDDAGEKVGGNTGNVLQMANLLCYLHTWTRLCPAKASRL
jgi:tripeptide aminopeptidase